MELERKVNRNRTRLPIACPGCGADLDLPIGLIGLECDNCGLLIRVKWEVCPGDKLMQGDELKRWWLEAEPSFEIVPHDL